MIRMIIFWVVGIVTLVVLLLLLIGIWLSPVDRLAKSDLIVVISGGDTENRVEAGVELYKDGWAPKILFSGAAAKGSVSNANSMSRIAQKLGVPSADIIQEGEAKNTLENAQYTKKIVDKLDIKSLILVTSPYHERRASIIFSHVFGRDFKIIRQVAVDDKWSRKTWFLTRYGWTRTIDELGGVVYFYLVQKKIPEPLSTQKNSYVYFDYSLFGRIK